MNLNFFIIDEHVPRASRLYSLFSIAQGKISPATLLDVDNLMQATKEKEKINKKNQEFILTVFFTPNTLIIRLFFIGSKK